MRSCPLTIATALLALSAAAHARPAADKAGAANLGQFTRQDDIGKITTPGSASYDRLTQTYTVSGSGDDIWAGSDDFHFVSKEASGDLTIAAAVTLVGPDAEPHRKAGLMIRQSLAPDAAYADVVVHGNGHVALQYRESAGAPTYEIGFDDEWVKRFALERQGDYVYMSAADADGVFHHVGGGFRLHLTGPYLVGLAVCAHSRTVQETATFAGLTITPSTSSAPTATGPDAKVESTLETVDVASAYRRVIYRTDDHIEAPNWLPDGKGFLFNKNGSLYVLSGPGGTPVKLDTGPLNRINNDHGISPDHRWIAVSAQTEADNGSRIFVLPIGGGTPRQVSPAGPSYWHGWSPDGSTLAVIGERAGEFDVYAVPVAGGPERRLTTAPGLDDGSEYSPDGQWIYFNSVRSGNMKIWRMHPDGSGQEQVTFGDHSRDWFPHVSPDGKWIAFVSFGTDVVIGDHPPNRDVMLKLMPISGGTPAVIAKLFGGQGTMNVNSWSPDSKQIAFVSYRLVR